MDQFLLNHAKGYNLLFESQEKVTQKKKKLYSKYHIRTREKKRKQIGLHFLLS